MKILLALVTLAFSAGAATPNFAWWLTTRIEPTGTDFHGIPLRQLSTPLRKLSLLSCNPNTRQFTRRQCEEVRYHKASFRLVGDFNRDGENEIAETGVGETPDGSKVRVLIISNRRDPNKNQVFISQDNYFSALFRSGSHFQVSDCMDCGEGVDVLWDKRQGRYVMIDTNDFGQ